MALSLQQVLKQTQKLIMTPQMQQSIQLLQLNSMELEQMIHDEMMENPFLELSDDEEGLASQVDSRDDSPKEEKDDIDTGLSDQERERSETATDDSDYSSREEDSAREDYVDDSPLAEKPDTTADSEDFSAFDENDVNWNEEFSDSDTITYASGTHESFEEHDFTTYTALNEGLYDSLTRQLRLSVLEGEELEIGEFIIGNLDESGFLDCRLENQAKMLGYPPDLVDLKGSAHSEDNLRRLIRKIRGPENDQPIGELKRKQLVAIIVGYLLRITPDEAMAMPRNTWLRALVARRIGKRYREIAEMPLSELILHTIAKRMKTDPQKIFDVLEVIQDFEPTGVAARDLAECLRLQCEEKGIRNRILYKILDDYLSDIQQKRFREIARALEVSESQIQEVFHIISHLDPRPGQSISKDSPRYITPDVYVKKIDDKYMYFLNEGDAGRLRVASSYRRLLHQKKQQQQQENAKGNGVSAATENQTAYAQEKYKNAVWLIKNIEKRKSTVLRVTEAIMNYQKDFLEKGIEHLHPLTLRNIAEVVGMHESTIARVTTQKYVETPRGIFELKFFFSSGLETDSGEDASSRSIKELITQMIEAEEPKKPLSDQKIADMLRDKGIQIARRTVAKYREQLKILPAKLRKSVS